MTTRREFLKAASAGSALIFGLPQVLGNRIAAAQAEAFSLHEFVETHPDAVFVMRTSVDAKTNDEAIRNTGALLGSTLFIPTAAGQGYPAAGDVAIKPNLTSWAWDKAPIETIMGIHTDARFVEGVIDALKGIGVAAQRIHLRDANFGGGPVDGAWYKAMAARSGVDLTPVKTLSQLPAGGVQWSTVPGAAWFSRIPHIWPMHASGVPLINIAKFKSHSMGMTLCSKNLQGAVASPYVAHCKAWGTAMQGVAPGDVVTDAFTTIKANYDRHKPLIPRWLLLDGDPGSGSAGGLWQETHASRCLDNNSVLTPLVNIIEGIYGREGPFVSGPDDNGGYGRDIMTNLLIFGKNARHVDLIGTYLAGHEPGNFGFFHLALERGLSRYLDPRKVPLYEWTSVGNALAQTLDAFPRAHIRTPYLRQAGEEQYHMLDQPYTYESSSAPLPGRPHAGPDAFVLSQNFPNPFNPTTSIQFTLPHPGTARLEIIDVAGRVVDRLVDGPVAAGDHLVRWDCAARASGTYYYRLLFDGTVRTRSMVLLR